MVKSQVREITIKISKSGSTMEREYPKPGQKWRSTPTGIKFNWLSMSTTTTTMAKMMLTKPT